MSPAAHAAPTTPPGSRSSGTAVPRGHHRTAGLCLLTLLTTVLLTMLWTAGPAAAHGEQSDEASVLVRQAIALIVSTPDDLGEIRERVTAAQQAPDTTGVDLALVAEADSALTDDADLAQVRTLLERSIGAGPVGAPTQDEPAPATTDPATTDPASPPADPTSPPAEGTPGDVDMATGAEPGDTVIAEPLEPRPTLDATDWTLLAGSILLGLVGVWAVLRFRPVPATTREG